MPERSVWHTDVRACRLRFAASERKGNICRRSGRINPPLIGHS